MNITIKHMRGFLAVAQTRSFAEASELIHLSQPALSITIKNLEESIGGQLFIRTTRSLALTPEGRTFLPVAKRLLADWDSAFNDLNNLFLLNRGNLTVAAMPSFASTVLPTHLNTFHQLHPSINIKVHDVIAEDAVALVRSGKVELAISFDPGESEDLLFEPLFTDNFVAALPKQHPLLNQSEITWQAFEKLPFITLQRPSNIRNLIDNALLEQDIVLNIEFETNQLATIGQMVATGLGVSAMPSLSIEQLRSMDVECRRLVSPVVSRRVGIITKHRSQLSTPTAKFKQLVQQSYLAD
ncbi:LysR family transcriptional regulator [Colwellia demingiae]|uniref:LysR family transcriptional regulator n=1 Tax=Colwellia demingiae TaxID=89401 RepID=A0A5C6Q6F4_9GAMM|nr:LysR family transcriptional regulator [Colwellia demingiae]TWX64368.1 LysR family transcriptional regulator [Colwellia demingiae]